MSAKVSAYLARLGLGDIDARNDSETLALLQERQMRAIAFENIDPLLGIVPLIDPNAVHAKLVDARRGGYCFELNALLRGVLSDLGFGPTTLLARVRNGAAEGKSRMHECMAVAADGREWLVDAGFGGPGPLRPLALDEPGPQHVPNGVYRLRVDPKAGETVVERWQEEGWFSLYGFDRVPVRPVDLVAANYLAARWDESPFGTHLMAACHADTKRLSLFNRRYRENETTRFLEDATALDASLREGFGICLDQPTLDALWKRIEGAPVDRPA